MLVSGYVDTLNFVSGFVWIGLIVLFAYLFYEHQVREKFPQNLILLLLLFDTILRSIWFFLSIDYNQFIITRIFNRMSILYQFTAISILMLMWLRALQITQMTYQISHHHLEENPGLDDESATNSEARQTKGKSNPTRAVASGTTKPPVLDEAAVRAEAERKQTMRIRVALAVNVFTWCFILGTCFHGDSRWYAVNLIMLSTLCLAEAIITLTIGVRTSLMLQKELTPVFQASNINLTTQTKIKKNGLFYRLQEYCGCADFYSLYQLFFSKTESALGLQLQRDVLKTLLNVSFIVFIFFFVRSFSFIYETSAEDLANGQGYSSDVESVLYPLFYYQLPELIPNLAIALGISPPNSILRGFVWWVKVRICGYKSPSYGTYDAKSFGSSDVSNNTGGSNNESVFFRKTDLVDTFSLYVDTSNSRIQSTATHDSLHSTEEKKIDGKVSFSHKGSNISIEKIDSSKQPSHSFANSAAPTNFKRKSQVTRQSLSALHEETLHDLEAEGSSSEDIEAKEKATDVERGSEPSERRTVDSFNASDSSFSRSSSNKPAASFTSFSISKPIPITMARDDSTFSFGSFRGSRKGNKGSSGDDSFLYSEENISSSMHSSQSKGYSSTDVSSSVPSALNTGSSHHSASHPRSYTIGGSRKGGGGAVSTSQQSFPMFQSPPYNYPTLEHLSREKSTDPNSKEYMEFLYRINSIGSYRSRESAFPSGDFETNPMFRKSTTSTNALSKKSTAGEGDNSLTTPSTQKKSNANNFNWYSQFW